MDSSQRTAETLGADFLNELEGLRALSRKIFRGQMRGERRSRNKGQSVEFVDYRPYITGDDLRSWVKSAIQSDSGGVGGGVEGFDWPQMPEIDFSKFGEIERQPD